MTLPGHQSQHTLLNVVRSKGPGRIRDAVLIDNLETKDGQSINFFKLSRNIKSILDSVLSLHLGKTDDQFYHEEDFEIGSIIDIGNREVKIVDCDAFTKKYYQEKYNKGNFRKEMIKQLYCHVHIYCIYFRNGSITTGTHCAEETCQSHSTS